MNDEMTKQAKIPIKVINLVRRKDRKNNTKPMKNLKILRQG